MKTKREIEDQLTKAAERLATVNKEAAAIRNTALDGGPDPRLSSGQTSSPNLVGNVQGQRGDGA
jgi:hypothetical protein